MGPEPLTTPIDPTSDLARILSEARAPVVLESDGSRYAVERENVFAGYTRWPPSARYAGPVAPSAALRSKP